jgi:hypothetical protein
MDGGSGRSLSISTGADVLISRFHATLRALVCIRMALLLLHLFEVQS